MRQDAFYVAQESFKFRQCLMAVTQLLWYLYNKPITELSEGVVSWPLRIFYQLLHPGKQREFSDGKKGYTDV